MGIPRQFIEHSSLTSKVSSSDVKLRVMTFNVLAQGLSSGSFVKCPDEALILERRVDAIVEEITTYAADVVCLQEVDMSDQLKSRLSGYTCVWKAKGASPCLHNPDNIGPDGSAIFYKSPSVKLISEHTMPLQADGVEANQLLLSLLLQLSNGHRLLLVCLHLKAKVPFADMRRQQMLFVLEFVKSKLSDCDSVVIAGDLNCDPHEPVHKLLESEGFVSSYVAATGQHPAYTTCKIRDTKQCHVEDYIYHKNVSSKAGLSIERVLEVPAEEALGEGRLPNMDYPSDHLSMVADYTIS